MKGQEQALLDGDPGVPWVQGFFSVSRSVCVYLCARRRGKDVKC